MASKTAPERIKDTTGFWWRPSQPEHRFAGRLTFDEKEGANLELTIEGGHRSFHGDEKFFHLNGTLNSGEAVTLVDCFEFQSPFPGIRIESREIFANVVLLGHHIRVKPEEALFREMSFRWPLLLPWLSRSGITVSHSQEVRDFSKFTIEYSRPTPISHTLSSGLTIELHVSPDSIPLTGFGGEAGFSELVWVVLKPKEPRDFRYFRNAVDEIRDFFSLLTVEHTPPDAVSLEAAFDEQTEGDETRYPNVDVVLRERFKRGKPLHFRDMLVSYPAIQKDFPLILGKWFDMAERLTPIRWLFFSTLYAPHGYIEADFLSMVQAVEAFHRRFRPGAYLPKQNFEQSLLSPLRQAIPSGLAEEIRNVVRGKLEYLNEYSLKTRLKALVAEQQDLIDQLVPDWKECLQRIVNARNHLTHYSAEREEALPDLRILVEDRHFLRLLLELSLCREIGVDKETLRKGALSCMKYAQLFSWRRRNKGG